MADLTTEVPIDLADGKRYTKADPVAQEPEPEPEPEPESEPVEPEPESESEPEPAIQPTVATGAKQVDPSDDAYTRDELVVAYDGAVEWKRAEPVPMRRKEGVKYCSFSASSPGKNQAKLMVAHLTKYCGWIEWPCEKYTYDFGYTADRPVRGERVDLCNSSFFSEHFSMFIAETDWLFDRLKLAELTGSMNRIESKICPPSYVLLPNSTETDVKRLCAVVSQTADVDAGCWFLKENLQNFGLGTHCIPRPDPSLILPLLRPNKGYVLQPHIARPALCVDERLVDHGVRAGRKFHLRLYLLIAQYAAWAREPICSTAGARFYVHHEATKIVVSPMIWDRAKTDKPTQVTTARGATSFMDWREHRSATAAMLQSVPHLVGALQTKLVTPANDKMSFELFGADYMLDEDGHAWLLEVNTGPVLHENDPLDVLLVRDIVNTVVLGDGTPQGGWAEVQPHQSDPSLDASTIQNGTHVAVCKHSAEEGEPPAQW